MSIESINSVSLAQNSVEISVDEKNNAAMAKAFEEILLKLMIDSSEMFSSENKDSMTGLESWKDMIKNGLVSELVSRDEMAYGRLMMQGDKNLKGFEK